MRLLVTRPQHQVADTIASLEGDGHEIITSPMLELHHLDLPQPVGAFNIIALTSRNAVDGLVRQWHSINDRGKRGDWTVFTVGDATRDAAARAGFVKAVSCRGSAPDLVEMIAGTHSSKPSAEVLGKHNILYPCALRPSHDLPALFEERGLNCASWPVYAMEDAEQFSPAAGKALSDESVDGVLLYSARSATTFARLFSNLDTKPAVPPLFALSEAVCAALPPELALHCRASGEPNEAALRLLLSQHKS